MSSEQWESSQPRMPNALFEVRAEPEIQFGYATAERMKSPLAGAYARRPFRTEGKARNMIRVCYRGADEEPAGGLRAGWWEYLVEFGIMKA
jgi:hypothetical protein